MTSHQEGATETDVSDSTIDRIDQHKKLCRTKTPFAIVVGVRVRRGISKNNSIGFLLLESQDRARIGPACGSPILPCPL